MLCVGDEALDSTPGTNIAQFVDQLEFTFFFLRLTYLKRESMHVCRAEVGVGQRQRERDSQADSLLRLEATQGPENRLEPKARAGCHPGAPLTGI